MLRGHPLLLAALLVGASLVLQGCSLRDVVRVTGAFGIDGCRATAPSAEPPKLEHGINIVPLPGALDVATDLAEDLRGDFTSPVHVVDEQRVPKRACDDETGQVRVEPVLKHFAQRYPDNYAVIVVSAEDIRSDLFLWQFGGVDPESSVAVLSSARLGQFVLPGADRDDVRRARVAALGRKYALVLWFKTRPGADRAHRSLLVPLLSFTLLDAADDDVCRYRELVGRHIWQFQPCAVDDPSRRGLRPSAAAQRGEVAALGDVWRAAIAHRCRDTRERLAEMAADGAPADFRRAARSQLIREAAIDMSRPPRDAADELLALQLEVAFDALARGLEASREDEPRLIAEVNARARHIGISACLG